MTHRFDVSERRIITAAEQNQYITPTFHPNRTMQEHDFVYMLDGAWKIGQEDEAFELMTGDVIILEANRPHYGIEKCAADTKTMFIHAQCLDSDAGGGLSLPSLINARKNYNVKRCFEKVIYAKACGDEQMSAVYFDALLYELSACVQPQSENAVAEQIRKMLIFSDNMPTNREIAEELHISLKTAENTFKKAYGKTIHQYLIELKIEKAKLYLSDFPDMLIYEIAAALGFYDEFHFSKQFKQSVGVSPRDYRRSVRNNQ